MARWPATKARVALAALKRIGWTEIRKSGSHRTLAREGWRNFTFAWHDGEEIWPGEMKWLGQQTGLTPEDL